MRKSIISFCLVIIVGITSKPIHAGGIGIYSGNSLGISFFNFPDRNDTIWFSANIGYNWLKGSIDGSVQGLLNLSRGGYEPLGFYTGLGIDSGYGFTNGLAGSTHGIWFGLSLPVGIRWWWVGGTHVQLYLEGAPMIKLSGGSPIFDWKATLGAQFRIGYK